MSKTPATAPRVDPRAAVEGLVLDFFAALDSGDFDMLLECLSEGCIWHRQGKILRGHQMVRSAMAERGREVRTAHLVTNLQVFSADHGAARARFYLLAYRFDGDVKDGEPAPMDLPASIGLYECRCARFGEALKITELLSQPRFRRPS